MINTVAQGVLGRNRSLSVEQVLWSARIWAWQRKYKPSENETARVVITLSHLASSTNVCSGCRMSMSHPMLPSYCWNGEAGSSWGRVFWKSRVRTSSTTRSDLLSLTRCCCSCKTKSILRPAKACLAARESFLNCRKRCKSSTSNMYLSLNNLLHTTTKSLHRNEIDICGPR